MNYHQGRNSGPNLDGGEEIRGPVNFVHPRTSSRILKVYPMLFTLSRILKVNPALL